MQEPSPLLDALAFVGLVIVYLAPTWIAVARRHRNFWLLMLINFGTAWTGLGWLLCLAWSLWRSADDGKRAAQ